jgi:hypothetical protein
MKNSTEKLLYEISQRSGTIKKKTILALKKTW